MRTRRGLCYPREEGTRGEDAFMSQEKKRVVVKRRRDFAGEHMACRKKNRKSPEMTGKSDLFDALPDDLVISILCKLSAASRCPTDFINVLLTYAFLYLFLRSSTFLVFLCREVEDSGLSKAILMGIADLSFPAKVFVFWVKIVFLSYKF